MTAAEEDFALAPNAAETAPKDGRAIRGYFARPGTCEMAFKAVAWDARLGWWVALYDRRLDRGWALASWGWD